MQMWASGEEEKPNDELHAEVAVLVQCTYKGFHDANEVRNPVLYFRLQQVRVGERRSDSKTAQS